MSAKPKSAPAPEPVAPPAPTLAELTARWATAKAAEELASREVKTLRAQIEAFPEAVIGYADDSLQIGETSVVDLNNKRLIQTLSDESLTEKVTVTKISLDLLHAAAKLHPKLAAAVERATASAPRWEQARKKN